MPNASHVLETALLLLAAFLIGCIGGYLLRRLAIRGSRPAAAAVAVEPEPATAAPLVVPPVLEPIIAPAAKVVAAPPAASTIQPARVAGQATSGRVIPAPAKQPEAAVEAEPASEKVIAAEVPPIDELAHVVEPAKPAEDPPIPVQESLQELSGILAHPKRASLRDEEAEDAAMRAIEGSWTPPPAPHSARRHIELPEPIDIGPPAVAPEPAQTAAAEASPAEIAGAISAVRSGVAAASAAAAAAIAEHLAPPVEARPQAPSAEQVPVPAASRAPFGKPPSLSAPRQGRGDDLRQIRGITAQLEAALNELGIFHFDQIAHWDKKAVVWMDGHLGLKGRIAREKWVEQARDLSKGRVFPARAARH